MALTFVMPPSLGPAKASARAEVLSGALSRVLGEAVTGRVSGSYGELEDAITSGQAHVAWVPSAVCARLSIARAALAVVRKGKGTYRSALVARKADRLSTTSLGGTRATWVDPLSAGGYLLVRGLLRSRGIDLDATFASQRFAGSYRAAIEAVLHRDADVAAAVVHAIDPAALAEMLRWYAGPPADALEAIAVSESCPNDALVLTGRLSPFDGDRFASALLVDTPDRARLLAGLEAESLVVTDLAAYRRALLSTSPPVAGKPPS